MKAFIVLTAAFFLNLLFLIDTQDYNMHERYMLRLKFVSRETAAAAAQLYDAEAYSEGRKVFNRSEGLKAAQYIVENNLKVSNTSWGSQITTEFGHKYEGVATPLEGEYAKEPILITIEFFDDVSADNKFSEDDDFYIEYDHDQYYQIITEPSVAVTINAGKPRYRLFPGYNDCVRSAIYEWKERDHKYWN